VYFKYYFPCPKQELTVNGEMNLLDLDALGEARVAMQDCTKVGHQCMLSDLGIHCQFGPGAMLDPFPTEGERPSFGFPPGNEDWAWLEFPWRGKVARIGFRPSTPPTPESLRRREQIAGYYVEDAHGRQWIIPVARDRSSIYGKLPSFLVPGDGEEWGRKLDGRYQWLWELSKQVWECLDCFYHRTNRPEFAFPWLPRQIARILGVNYRIGSLELKALSAMDRDLLTDGFCANAAESLIDMQAIDAYFKQKSQDSAPDQKKTLSDSPMNSPATIGVVAGPSTSPV
jgi:hypothetical protein